MAYLVLPPLRADNEGCPTGAIHTARCEGVPSMVREQLRTLLRQRPFRAFRVHLTDGRVFDVRYPRMNLLAPTFIKIGIPESNGPDPMCEYTEYVPFTLIARIEEMNSSQPSATA